MTNKIKIGETIQDFRLRDQKREEVHLYDQKGKKVLLSFHPLAWTQVCAQQMKSLEENHELFAGLNTVPFGISVDPCLQKKPGQGSLELPISNFFRISGRMEKLPELTEYSRKKKASLKGRI